MAYQCKMAGCAESSMDNDSSLCEPHFEARRDALKARLERDGPVPVVKQVLRKRDNLQPAPAQYSVWKVSLSLLVFGAFWFFYVLAPEAGSGASARPPNFAAASADQVWRIDSENIALLGRPEQPGSAIDMMDNLITIIPIGSRVLVTKGRPAETFKQAVLVDRPDVSGWIQAQTVSSAELLR